VVFSVLVGCAVKNALRRERSAICISNTRNIFYAPYFPELAEKYAGFAT
jgi:hypothetical protein